MDYLNGKPEPIGASLLLHKFAPSVKMSTYLVAFVIGNFVSLEKTVSQAATASQSSPSDVLVRVWGTPANAFKLQYALDAAAFMLPHFSKV
jgi:aminopeptidase N